MGASQERQYGSPSTWGRTGIAVLVHGRAHRHGPLVERLLADGAEPAGILLVHNPSAIDDPSPSAPDGVRTIRMRSNLGYAAAMNFAVRELEGRELLLLCTDDLRLEPGAASTLLGALGPGIAAVGPLLFRPDGSVFSSGGVFTKREHRPVHLTDAPPRRAAVGWLDGSCLATSQGAWSVVGPFDERLFLYGEDVEWSERCKERNLRCVVEPSARATQSPGAEARRELYAYLGMRNGLAVCRWHQPRHVFALRVLQDLRMTVMRALRGADGPASAAIGVARLRGMFDGVLGRLGPPPSRLHPDRHR